MQVTNSLGRGWEATESQGSFWLSQHFVPELHWHLLSAFLSLGEEQRALGMLKHIERLSSMTTMLRLSPNPAPAKKSEFNIFSGKYTPSHFQILLFVLFNLSQKIQTDKGPEGLNTPKILPCPSSPLTPHTSDAGRVQNMSPGAGFGTGSRIWGQEGAKSCCCQITSLRDITEATLSKSHRLPHWSIL